MTLSIGLDIVHLPEFAAQLATPGTRFALGVFTVGERAGASARDEHAGTRHLAGRYAAKEALIKALDGRRWGSPPALNTVDLRDIEVVADAWGRPALHLHGPVAQIAAGLMLSLSISHDGPTVAATVIAAGL